MENGAKKSFYIFLCAMLGMMLFVLLQRSLLLLGFLFGFNVLAPAIQQLDYVSFLLFLFSGLWYGIWLGLHWYGAVYERREVRGFIHSLFGHRPLLRGSDRSSRTWNVEDLLRDSEDSAPAEPTLSVFKEKIIRFSDPVSASAVHAQRAARPVSKRTVRGTTGRKPVRIKSATE